jgi:hypothetical protein
VLQEVFQTIDKMQPVRLKPSANEYADFFWPLALVGLAFCGLQVVSAFGLRYTPW